MDKPRLTRPEERGRIVCFRAGPGRNNVKALVAEEIRAALKELVEVASSPRHSQRSVLLIDLTQLVDEILPKGEKISF